MSAIAMLAFGMLLAQPAAETTGLLKPTKSTLDDVVKNVQKNEKLYETIEFTIRRESKLVPWDRKEKAFTPAGEAIATSTETIHLILDGERFLEEEEHVNMGANSKQVTRSSRTHAYDGKETRKIRRRDQVTVRLCEGLEPPSPDALLHPNVFFYDSWNMPTPLSKYLTMPDKPGSDMRWTVLGEEKVKNLRCVKLHFELVQTNKGVNWFEAYFWLAIDRNYLPVQCTEIKNHLQPDLEHYIGWVNSLKEVKPGIWMPESGEMILHDYKALEKGLVVPKYRTVFEVEDVKLGQQYAAETFRPEIPDGALVEKVKDGKIIDTYRQGANQ